MLNVAVLREKLAKLVEFLRELEEVKSSSFEDYSSNPAIKRSCERLIQLIVETAADINSNIIVALKDLPPKDYYDTFIKVGEVGIISADLSKKLAPWAGLRNRLVHEYAEIKDRLVFEKVEPTINIFTQYVREIEKFLVSC
jgi:uncharacterized protein YutE (UPF0331/DUF86 family)